MMGEENCMYGTVVRYLHIGRIKGTQFEKSRHRSGNDKRDIQNIGEEVSRKLL